jgi:hypothetical protein
VVAALTGPSRREVLVGAAALAACRRGPAWARTGRDALDAAISWSYAQQASNGAFPSATYGFFRLGESLTALTADALVRAGSVTSVDRDRLDAALTFLIGAARGGAIGLSGPAPDYPVYATSLALTAWVGAGRRADPVAASIAWLAGQQLRADLGWTDHPGEGGFPMGRATPLAPPDAGHVDLSMTRRALEALRVCGADAAPFAAGRRFVDRCAAPGGGFVYSPVETGVNKGGEVDGAQQGYGSATADGLLTLVATGAEPTSAEVSSARDFLVARHTWDENPGIGGGPLAGFATAMRFYWRASAARAYRAAGGPTGWAESLVAALIADQGSDGSFRNASPLQKEDDPVLATGLAVSALADALGAGT